MKKFLFLMYKRCRELLARALQFFSQKKVGNSQIRSRDTLNTSWTRRTYMKPPWKQETLSEREWIVKHYRRTPRDSLP